MGALPPLVARTSTRIAGDCRIAVNRQIIETAKAAIERRQHLGDPVGAPDHREDAAGFENSPAGMNPAVQRLCRRDMGDRTRTVRRGAVPRGIVERRVHQHDIDAVGRKAGRCEIFGAGGHIKHDDFGRNRIG